MSLTIPLLPSSIRKASGEDYAVLGSADTYVE